MEFLFFRVKARLLLAEAALIVTGVGTHLHLRRVEIEQDGQVGKVSLRGNHRETRHQLYPNVASVTLIGNTGIEAAIGDDQQALCQGRNDDFGEMLGAVGLEKKGLRQGSYG